MGPFGPVGSLVRPDLSNERASRTELLNSLIAFLTYPGIPLPGAWIARVRWHSQGSASRGGCRTNPRRPRWSLSKGGFRKAATRLLGSSRSTRRPSSHQLQGASQPPRRSFSGKASCDSLRELRGPPSLDRRLTRTRGERPPVPSSHSSRGGSAERLRWPTR